MSDSGKVANRTTMMYNLHLLDIRDCDPDTGMPVLQPAELTPPKRLIAATESKNKSDGEAGIHFWLDDFRFEYAWNDPMRYVTMLERFHCVLEPDFSVYVNMPLPMQRWNVFRGRAVAKIWQDAGLCVVPKLTWGFPESYGFCFDGLPRGGVYALSTVGLAKSKELIEFFKEGASAAVSAVHPDVILAYGKPLDFDSGGAEVIWYKSAIQERFADMRAAMKAAKENDEKGENDG